jgi:hypothetical protein
LSFADALNAFRVLALDDVAGFDDIGFEEKDKVDEDDADDEEYEDEVDTFVFPSFINGISIFKELRFNMPVFLPS